MTLQPIQVDPHSSTMLRTAAAWLPVSIQSSTSNTRSPDAELNGRSTTQQEPPRLNPADGRDPLVPERFNETRDNRGQCLGIPKDRPHIRVATDPSEVFQRQAPCSRGHERKSFDCGATQQTITDHSGVLSLPVLDLSLKIKNKLSPCPRGGAEDVACLPGLRESTASTYYAVIGTAEVEAPPPACSTIALRELESLRERLSKQSGT